jgi:hypothetical protein
MKIISLLTLIALSKFSYSQRASYPHGSLIVAVICNDGILMAADSRSSFTAYNDIAKKELPYAYFDSSRKIFQLGKYQVGITGNGNVGNDFWENIIEKYNKKSPKNLTIENTFKHFRNYLHKKIHIHDSLLRGNFFILAGFENKLPVLLAADSLNDESLFRLDKIKHRLLSQDCIKANLVLNDSLYYTNKILPFVIDGFAKCSKDFELGIGGPYHIIKITTNNNVETISDFEVKRFKTYLDFEISILNQETQIIHFFPETVEPFNSWIKENVIRKKEILRSIHKRHKRNTN